MFFFVCSSVWRSLAAAAAAAAPDGEKCLKLVKFIISSCLMPSSYAGEHTVFGGVAEGVEKSEKSPPPYRLFHLNPLSVILLAVSPQSHRQMFSPVFFFSADAHPSTTTVFAFVHFFLLFRSFIIAIIFRFFPHVSLSYSVVFLSARSPFGPKPRDRCDSLMILFRWLVNETAPPFIVFNFAFYIDLLEFLSYTNENRRFVNRKNLKNSLLNQTVRR